MLINRWPIYDRVLANLVDGSAISGLLIDKRGPLIILADATLLTETHEPTPLDGEVYIERDKVLFLQVAPPKE